METIVERRKLRNEEAEVDTIRVLEGWYVDGHLVVRRHRWLRKSTYGNGGFR
jgi:hypothetical protein